MENNQMNELKTLLANMQQQLDNLTNLNNSKPVQIDIEKITGEVNKNMRLNSPNFKKLDESTQNLLKKVNNSLSEEDFNAFYDAMDKSKRTNEGFNNVRNMDNVNNIDGINNGNVNNVSVTNGTNSDPNNGVASINKLNVTTEYHPSKIQTPISNQTVNHYSTMTNDDLKGSLVKVMNNVYQMEPNDYIEKCKLISEELSRRGI